MANYRGYFRGFDIQSANNQNGDLYCVHIGDFSANTYTELLMADTPFVVQYNTSNTPFDPVRTSTATIKVLNSGYTVDLFPTKAQEKPVVLYNETKSRIEWCGFITPKVYDGSYVDCLDEISIEAADCISSLQYVDYEIVNSTSGKSIVSLNKILGQICNGTGILDRFYWTNGKMFDSSNPMLPEQLFLSEQNFYSSDTDEPWKMNAVLEEICRYFGFTCMQFGNAMYLIDFLSYKEREQIITRYYTKSNNYVFQNGNILYLTGGNCTVGQNDLMGSNTSISLEPIYNKCTVKANMYACDRIIPAIFEDNNLVNRFDSGNFYTNIELTVPSPATASYPYGCEWLVLQGYKKEDSADTEYSYYMRVYDSNKGWKSIYNGSAEDKPTSQIDLTNCPGATVVDLGVVRNLYIEYGQQIKASKLDYTRYLMINQHNIGSALTANDYLVYDLSDYANICPFKPSDAYLVIQGSAINEKYTDRCYINPSWSTNRPKLGGIGGSILWSESELCFLVKIGDKYWSGSGWTSQRTTFMVYLQLQNDEYGHSNTERSILNNVDYNLEVGEDGYIIPLAGVNCSLTDKIQIQVHMPTLQYIMSDGPCYNGFVWIKDLDVKLVQKGQSSENNEGDMIYENVINEDAVSELSDITCKLTSYTSGVAPSYSTVMYSKNGIVAPLSGFVDNSSIEARAGEENIIEKYVHEYQHQTRKITYTLDNNKSGLRPWSRFTYYDPEEPNQMYVVLGNEIDYQKGTNTITAIELK